MSMFNSTLHIPQAVQNIAVAYDPSRHGFVWDRLLPRYVSEHRTDYIRSIDKGQTLRLYDLRSGKGLADPRRQLQAVEQLPVSLL